jgi:hypothetical protein
MIIIEIVKKAKSIKTIIIEIVKKAKSKEIHIFYCNYFE